LFAAHESEQQQFSAIAALGKILITFTEAKAI
jgi:hypothetical protein